MPKVNFYNISQANLQVEILDKTVKPRKTFNASVSLTFNANKR